VAQGTHVIDRGEREIQSRIPRRAIILLLAIAAVAAGGVYYLTAAALSPAANSSAVPGVHAPAAKASVLTGSPATLSAKAAASFFSSDPVVVLAGSARRAVLTGAVQDAVARSAPLMLADASLPLVSPAVRAEIGKLHAGYVLAVGLAARTLAAELPGVSVVTSTGGLPVSAAPAPVRTAALLVHAGQHGVVAPAGLAATATARAAGVRVITLPGYDPRAVPAAISALAAARPQHVLAIGGGFGTQATLAAKIGVAETGVQLPGGGQLLFPGHRLVAMYGHPGTPGLGALGEQGLAASIARIQALARPYRALSRVQVVPAFEIIATVAQGSAGRNGLYTYETSVAALRPWVDRAAKAGLYVILDLQPGRAGLLAQAKLYKSLLRLPDVGLALDPEWELQPGQVPLQQIGSASVAEINSVVHWLAALTARYRLPQKLLVLHQFRLAMIEGEPSLDTHEQDLAIVIHMDGQGSPADKVNTWDAVTAAAPPGVFFGWKNFFVKDHPMMDPTETMDRKPQPVMISYQ
jgi:hypothetical protein